MNKVKQLKSKLPGLALILQAMQLNGRNITTGRWIKREGIQNIDDNLLKNSTPPAALSFLPFVRTFGWFGSWHYKLHALLCCFVTIKR